MERRGIVTTVAGVGLGALAARELLAFARVRGGTDPGGRHDHRATVGSGLGEPLELVLLGDSAVDGYGLSAEASLPRQVAARLSSRTGRRVRVRSLAVSGATTADVASFQLPLLRATGPVDAVVVGVGVNDAIQRVDLDAVEQGTRAIVDGVLATATDTALAYVPCHDLSVAPGLGPVLRRALGWRCRRVAARQLGVLEDLAVPVARADRPGTATMFGEDGLHPGARGVEVIASLVVGALVADTAGTDGLPAALTS